MGALLLIAGFLKSVLESGGNLTPLIVAVCSFAICLLTSTHADLLLFSNIYEKDKSPPKLAEVSKIVTIASFLLGVAALLFFMILLYLQKICGSGSGSWHYFMRCVFN